METMDIRLTVREYGLLERSLRGNKSLSQRLSGNLPISKNELITELLKEIRSLEYDEGDGIPLENRMYERGRELLKTITQKLYPNEASKYMGYLSEKKLINIGDFEHDVMVTIKIV
ncbi:MAG TPA: hypothetical protein VF941_20310 [Clostridia bacterium]